MNPLLHLAAGARTLVFAVASSVILMSIPVGAAGQSWEILADESMVALVTHRKGFAGSLAHNHLIAADVTAVVLTFDAAAPESTTFSMVTSAEALDVDRADLQARSITRLRELHILDEFNEISDKDRAEVRRKMLGGDQLDAENNPEIVARLNWITRIPPDSIDTAAHPPGFGWRGGLQLTAGGGSVEVPILARYQMQGDTLLFEAFGETRFTLLGIKPYSAFLGAVKNDDVLHLYLSLRAVPSGS